MNSVSRQSPENSVGPMFDRIAPVYDRLNHILSFGMDFLWRSRLAGLVDRTVRLRVLDLAAGSGDLLVALLRKNPNIIEAVGLDISQNMLAICRKKLLRGNLESRASLVCADARATGLSDNAFDLVTMGFGIRNTPDVSKTLAEIFRLLKKGGTVLILEFSMPSNRIAKFFYLPYLRYCVPFIGRILSGDGKAYEYLNTSIENFSIRHDLCALMRQTGFQDVEAIPLTIGTVCIYRGTKIGA